MLSKERLDAIRARCEAATEGPWNTVTNRDRGPWVNEDASVYLPDRLDLFIRNWKEGCLNAVFIAKARQDVPDLLAEIERQRKVIKELERLGQIEFAADQDRFYISSIPTDVSRESYPFAAAELESRMGRGDV
jgi:hypothetical protein